MHQIDISLDCSSWGLVDYRAKAASLANPGSYITVTQVYSACWLTVRGSLHPLAPSDAPGGYPYYWLNGTRRKFTTAQRAADSRRGHLGR
jgi:hypothetical protein